MNAITTYERGQIKFAVSLCDLVDAIPREERHDALQAIAADDDVIRHVMDQVLTGCTQNGSSGPERLEDWRLDYGMPSALELARRAIVGFAPQATQRYVEKMRRALEHMRKRVDEHRAEAYRAEEAARAARRHEDERARSEEVLRRGLDGEIARYRELTEALETQKACLVVAVVPLLKAIESGEGLVKQVSEMRAALLNAGQELAP